CSSGYERRPSGVSGITPPSFSAALSSVLTRPGTSAFTRIPKGAHSSAATLVRPSRPDFDAPYAAYPSAPEGPKIDEVLTTAGLADSLSKGSIVCSPRKAPVRL